MGKPKKQKKVIEEKYIYRKCPEGLDQRVYEKIRQRRIQMLIHSHLYYRMNINLITDFDFDKWGRELAVLQRDYPLEAEACEFAEYFTDWDGSTGCHLPYFPWIDSKAQQLHEYDRKHRSSRAKENREP